MDTVTTLTEERPTRPDAERPGPRSAARARDARVREDIDHRRSLISQLPLFSGLDPAVLDRIAEATELRKVAAGVYVARAGEVARHFYGVVFGQVQLLLGDPDSDPSVLSLAGPGTTFGEAAMWLSVANPVSARATQPSVILAFPRPVVETLALRDPEIALRLLVSVCQRLNHVVANLGSHKQKSGEQRLASYLLGLPNLNGDATRPRVRLPASKGTIASLVSIQPETLSRILRRFQQNGWIEMRGRELTIAEREALRTLVDAPVAHRH